MAEPVRPEPSRIYRWMVLIFLSIAMFGNYYVYDALSPLADVLKQQLGFSDSNIGLLQAIYSFPNIFTVVIGGIIIDRIGLRKSLDDFWRPLLHRAGNHGVNRTSVAHGDWAPDFRHGGGVADCCGNSGSGPVVPGQGTELCFRHQPYDFPAGFVYRAELPHLGAHGPTQTGAGRS